GEPQPVACDNESNAVRLWGTANRSPYPKDGINDHVVSGAATVNPDGRGTKAALHYVLTVPPGESREGRLRLTMEDLDPAIDAAPAGGSADLGSVFAEVMAARQTEADEFFADLTPSTCTADEALVLRQAVAGLLWSKQYYHYNVARWLQGDP